MGKCFQCGEWNTYTEEILAKENERQTRSKNWQDKGAKSPQPVALSDVKAGKIVRLVTPDNELNRVLGGGIVPGSLVLIGGRPELVSLLYYYKSFCNLKKKYFMSLAKKVKNK